MYGGDTWMPTFIFKSAVFKSAACLCQRWQFAGISKKERGKRHIIVRGIAFVFGAPIRIWLPSAASAPFYFYLDCVRERYSLRSVDIWREGLIKLVFCGGRDVNEPLSNEQPIVIWTMASFDSDYFYYWKWYLASFKGRYDFILIRYKKKNHNHCQ